MSLGKKLIQYRNTNDRSQSDTAKLLGVAQSTYSEWESDKSKPKAENYFKIAQLYNIEIKALIDTDWQYD